MIIVTHNQVVPVSTVDAGNGYIAARSSWKCNLLSMLFARVTIIINKFYKLNKCWHQKLYFHFHISFPKGGAEWVPASTFYLAFVQSRVPNLSWNDSLRLEKLITWVATSNLLLSAAEGQRPRNYSSCCCSWIFCLIYALSTSTTMLPPIF